MVRIEIKYRMSPHLRKLSFVSWNLGVKGATSLAEGMMRNIKITDLMLSYNQINDEAVANLMVPLTMKNWQLKNLDLSNNNIGDQGGVIISNFIAKSNTISKLNLKNNMIETDGGKAIRDVIYNKSSFNLVMLSLAQNLVDIKIEEEIDDMIYRKMPFHL